MQGRDNLTLCDRLTAADNPPIKRLTANQLRTPGGGKLLEAHHMPPVHPFRLFLQREARCPEHPHHVTGNCRRRGQPRRFDARYAEKARRLGFPDNKILLIRQRPQTGKIADGFTKRNARHRFCRRAAHKLQPLGCRAQIAALRGLRIRPHNQVTMYRRRYQHPLPLLAGALKDHVLYQRTLAFIQQVILPFAGMNGEGCGI